jgi:hypothetical protein
VHSGAGAVFGEQGREDGHLTVARMVMSTQALISPRKVATLVDLRDESIEVAVPFSQSMCSMSA